MNIIEKVLSTIVGTILGLLVFGPSLYLLFTGESTDNSSTRETPRILEVVSSIDDNTEFKFNLNTCDDITTQVGIAYKIAEFAETYNAQNPTAKIKKFTIKNPDEVETSKGKNEFLNEPEFKKILNLTKCNMYSYTPSTDNSDFTVKIKENPSYNPDSYWAVVYETRNEEYVKLLNKIQENSTFNLK